MGALRINKTDGTSVFLDLSSYTSAKIKESYRNKTTLEFTKLTGGSDEWDVQRFETTPDCIWEWQMFAAYNAIAIAPIKYGYPNLGNTVEKYITYDASKFGTAAIEQALTDQQEDNIPYTERTAICTNVSSQDDATDIVDKLEIIKSDVEAEGAALASACAKAIADGETFTWPIINVICDSAECCTNSENAYVVAALSKQIDELGIIINWKHQYLWHDLVPAGPAQA